MEIEKEEGKMANTKETEINNTAESQNSKQVEKNSDLNYNEH